MAQVGWFGIQAEIAGNGLEAIVPLKPGSHREKHRESMPRTNDFGRHVYGYVTCFENVLSSVSKDAVLTLSHRRLGSRRCLRR